MKKISLYFFSIALLAGFSCKSDHDKIDLKNIDVKVEIKRFDKDLLGVKIENIDTEIQRLNKDYAKFFPMFCEGIISIGKVGEPEFPSFLESFLGDKMINETYNKVQTVFPNLDDLNIEFTNAFKRFHYYFPEKPIPTIYSFISGFNQSVVLADSLLGIGLDRYLGRDCEYYPRLGIPKYSIYDMHPVKIPSDCIRAWAIGEYPFNDSIDNLVNNMIYEGMLMYFTKKMLPEQSDSLIFGFSPQQMDWCEANEQQVWTYLIENRLLFKDDSFLINKYINNAPFTSGLSQESPGRTVVWMGYRIVNSYVKNNKDVTFQQLMNERDYQKIFNQSKYRP